MNMVINLFIAGLSFIIILYVMIHVIHESKKSQKHITDFYLLFVMGLAWIIIGVVMKNFQLTTTGIILGLIGLLSKDSWHKGHHEWHKLSKKEKRKMLNLIIILALVLLFSLIIYANITL